MGGVISGEGGRAAREQEAVRRLLCRVVEHMHDTMRYQAEILDNRVEELQCKDTKVIEKMVI